MTNRICMADDPADPLNVAFFEAARRSATGQTSELKRQRFYVMQQLAWESIQNNWQADVVECGCWRGHSTLLIEALVTKIATGRLHVFDSFEGLSEFRGEDASPQFSTIQTQQAERAHFKSDFDHLAKLIDPVQTVLHKGWIPEVFKGVEVGEISFANIDVDLYQPTRDALAFCYPRLVRGGVIYLDDYGSLPFPGATRAVDEFVSKTPDVLFVKQPFVSAFLVKR